MEANEIYFLHFTLILTDFDLCPENACKKLKTLILILNFSAWQPNMQNMADTQFAVSSHLIACADRGMGRKENNDRMGKRWQYSKGIDWNTVRLDDEERWKIDLTMCHVMHHTMAR